MHVIVLNNRTERRAVRMCKTFHYHKKPDLYSMILILIFMCKHLVFIQGYWNLFTIHWVTHDSDVAQWLEGRRKMLMILTRSNPTEGRESWDRINRGPVLQQVWHVIEPSLLKAVSAKHRSKFASPSPIIVTSAGWLKKLLIAHTSIQTKIMFDNFDIY
jgi:hypothetical protein